MTESSLKLILVFVVALVATRSAAAADQPSAAVSTIDLEPRDAKRDRVIPVRIYVTDRKTPQPVVLFSHGLGGSREGNGYLGRHWAESSFVAVFMQHAGSDRDLMKGVPRLKRFSALKDGISRKSSSDRFADVSFVIDRLTEWNRDPDHALHNKLDLESIGMSGHSFGAATTLGMAGRKIPLSRSAHDGRIDAFLAMSPQPGKVLSTARAFGSISFPVMCMTGTEDNSPIDPTVTPLKRQSVFHALPDGNKYQLVFDGGHHFTFSDVDGIRRRQRDPKHHPAILKTSVKFWQAYLTDDSSAKGWLMSDAPKSDGTLQPTDTWEWK